MIYTIIDYVLLLFDIMLTAYALNISVGNNDKKKSITFIFIYYIIVATKLFLKTNIITLDAIIQTLTPIVFTILLLKLIYKIEFIKLNL